ncbi:hypothetical protein PR048_002410 [Dryococelus australis]|uniref:Uncharacterized protein n=1 Tax=Dryococelus australis TaxID=614101 RepID=A0ABQ9IK47_9NEOP|nr:hypothetical protein PR048_002410 [Dryococelus australis]
MSNVLNGCAAKFQKLYPQAMYVHCANYSLHLTLSHPCTVSAINNCFGNMNISLLSSELCLRGHCTKKQKVLLHVLELKSRFQESQEDKHIVLTLRWPAVKSILDFQYSYPSLTISLASLRAISKS